jgi:hypothetical protein
MAVLDIGAGVIEIALDVRGVVASHLVAAVLALTLVDGRIALLGLLAEVLAVRTAAGEDQRDGK